MMRLRIVVSALALAAVSGCGAAKQADKMAKLANRKVTEQEIRDTAERVRIVGVGLLAYMLQRDAAAPAPDSEWTSLLEREQILVKPDWQNGNKQFVDAWEQPLIYRAPGKSKEKRFELYSVGPDGVDDNGTGDDIVSEYY